MWVDVIYLPMKMEQTECSETSAYKLQTPEYYPKESIQQYISDIKAGNESKARKCSYTGLVKIMLKLKL